MLLLPPATAYRTLTTTTAPIFGLCLSGQIVAYRISIFQGKQGLPKSESLKITNRFFGNPGDLLGYNKVTWIAGTVICLGRGADLHVAQLMPQPFIVSCFRKIQIGSGTGSPG